MFLSDTFRIGQIIFLMIGLAAMGGCSDGIELGQVRGRITNGGIPLDDIQIQFIPDPNAKVPGGMAWAVSDANGQFEMEYQDGLRGVAVGKNKVTLEDLKPENTREGVPPKSRVPQSMRSPFETPYSFDVVSGEQTFDVDLSVK
jgi:hypothetical protein